MHYYRHLVYTTSQSVLKNKRSCYLQIHQRTFSPCITEYKQHHVSHISLTHSKFLSDHDPPDQAPLHPNWIQWEQLNLQNKLHYLQNRDSYLTEYCGKWLGFSNQKLISIENDSGDAWISIYTNLLRYHQNNGNSDQYIVLCGNENVTHLPSYLDMNCLSLGHYNANDTEYKTGGTLSIAPPHELEWIPQEKGSFKIERIEIEQTDERDLDDQDKSVLPFATIPISFGTKPDVEYPVTFFLATGIGRPGGLFSKQLFEVYRENIDPLKHNHFCIDTTINNERESRDQVFRNAGDSRLKNDVNVIEPLRNGIKMGIGVDELKICKGISETKSDERIEESLKRFKAVVEENFGFSVTEKIV